MTRDVMAVMAGLPPRLLEYSSDLANKLMYKINIKFSTVNTKLKRGTNQTMGTHVMHVKSEDKSPELPEG